MAAIAAAAVAAPAPRIPEAIAQAEELFLLCRDELELTPAQEEEARRHVNNYQEQITHGKNNHHRDDAVRNDSVQKLLQRLPDWQQYFSDVDLAQLRARVHLAWLDVKEAAAAVQEEKADKERKGEKEDPEAGDACPCALRICKGGSFAECELTHRLETFQQYALHLGVLREAQKLNSISGEFRQTVLGALWGWLCLTCDSTLVRWERHPAFRKYCLTWTPTSSELERLPGGATRMCMELADAARDIVACTALYVFLDRTVTIDEELGQPSACRLVKCLHSCSHAPHSLEPHHHDVLVKSVKVYEVQLMTGTLLSWRDGALCVHGLGGPFGENKTTISWLGNFERARELEAARAAHKAAAEERGAKRRKTEQQ